MIEIICRGNSPSEANVKCMVTEVLLTEKTMSTDMMINLLNAIGGVYITESESDGER